MASKEALELIGGYLKPFLRALRQNELKEFKLDDNLFEKVADKVIEQVAGQLTEQLEFEKFLDNLTCVAETELQDNSELLQDNSVSLDCDSSSITMNSNFMQSDIIRNARPFDSNPDFDSILEPNDLTTISERPSEDRSEK